MNNQKYNIEIITNSNNKVCNRYTDLVTIKIKNKIKRGEETISVYCSDPNWNSNFPFTIKLNESAYFIMSYKKLIVLDKFIDIRTLEYNEVILKITNKKILL